MAWTAGDPGACAQAPGPPLTRPSAALSPACLLGAVRRRLPSLLVPRSSVEAPPRPSGTASADLAGDTEHVLRVQQAAHPVHAAVLSLPDHPRRRVGGPGDKHPPRPADLYLPRCH